MDVEVIDGGSIVMLHPLSEAATEWIDENVAVPDYMWMGPNLCVERRYALDILGGMQDAGLEIRAVDAVLRR